MTRAEIKAVNKLVCQAEGDAWHAQRNLVRLLSFAIKLRELAFPARCNHQVGRKACRAIVRLLVQLVVDPSAAEKNASDAAYQTFQNEMRCVDRSKLISCMREVVRAGDVALHDATLINHYAQQLIGIYDIVSQVEEQTLHLSLTWPNGGEITVAQMKDWQLWSRDNFLRKQVSCQGLGDILEFALRQRSLDARVEAALAERV